MKFFSTTEIAEKWGFSARWISNFAREGRIPGAVKIGSSWMIPENATKPIDGRTKISRKENKKTADYFRYPIFEYQDLSSFCPPLSREELCIKEAIEAFYACRFEDGNRILGNLPETAENRYVRIYALRLGCAADIFLCNTDRFFERYGRLAAEFQTDFPHKREMEECIHELHATLGNNEYYVNQFEIVPDYPYHSSFLPHLTSLNGISLSFAGDTMSLKDIQTQEINCLYLERENALVDLQSMHVYLGCAYALLKKPDEMTCHFKRALWIAEKYDLFYVPAVQYFYMRKPMSQALKGFSDSFKKKLTSFSDDIHKRYLAFTDIASVNTIYRLLPHDGYVLLYYAVQGYTNKDVAELMHVSQSTIAKLYSEIYTLIGVKSKQEMVQMYENMHRVSINRLPHEIGKLPMSI